MKLALLGYPIAHSLSPKLYQELLGAKLVGYDLLEIKNSNLIPSLSQLAGRYTGISITTPYKKHFFDKVQIDSALVMKLQAINTLSFRASGVFATNTDVIAVEQILRRSKAQFSNLQLIILGDGVMAQLTVIVAKSLDLRFKQYSRKNGDNVEFLNLSDSTECQTMVINCCSRDFIFRGKLHSDFIFWDYNYSFIPHQSTLPLQVKIYMDGQEMLRLQALAAIQFWSAT